MGLGIDSPRHWVNTRLADGCDYAKQVGIDTQRS